MKKLNKKSFGFTLLEILLAMAIMSGVLLLLINYSTQKSDQMRRENVAKEMQQILNAALAFYVTNGTWPGKTVGATKTSCTTGWLSFDGTADLQIQGYLPAAASMPTVAGVGYQFMCVGATGLFQVKVALNLPADQTIVAGMVPLGSISAPWVIGQVNIPGQNLNNARSLNFAGVYYAGSCVPAPTCPLNMTPNIVVTPSAVSGITDLPSCSSLTPPYDPSTCTANVYPVSSFVGFARGDTNGFPTDPNDNTYMNGDLPAQAGPPLDCETSSTPKTMPCTGVILNTADTTSTPTAADTLKSNGTLYWRVCLYIRTENGVAYPTNAGGAANAAAWGKMLGTVLVFTRCVPTNESIGSNNVWQSNNSYTP